jgi:hypothetical protein
MARSSATHPVAQRRVTRTARQKTPARSPARAASAPAAFHAVNATSSKLGTSRWSFDGVVRRVLAFSRAAELEARVPGTRAAPREPSTRTAAALSPALDALNLFVLSLDDETRGKLQAVMQAGRDARALPDAAAALGTAQEAPGTPASPLFGNGSGSLQDLQRGHAVACATEFDLELKLARWGNVRLPATLDDRVWLRFGRELARSSVEEWSCHAILDARDRLEKLYLRCGQNAWWSFGAVIDRPSTRELASQRSAKHGRSRVVTLSLRAALARSSRADLRAVRRASIAVSARLGIGGVSLRDGANVQP